MDTSIYNILMVGVGGQGIILASEIVSEAVMNAGDAELRNIDNRPGGNPVLLSRLGDKPLAVTLAYLSRREVPRVDEIGDQLARFARR